MTDPEKYAPGSLNWLDVSELDFEQNEVFRKSADFAHEFWKRLVKNLGERRAKQLMNRVMGNKQSGPPERLEDYLLTLTIISFIRAYGQSESDAKIAKRILQDGSSFSFVLDQGETIVKRTISKNHLAMKKQVERVRRSLIEEKILPKEYAPRQYCRD
jgi:hypothetical protein